ncbi:hypothetical protein [Mycobacterium leprae]|uniref:hypothetical protein n=1 Tax=Mycobacterium leprae TaxID=1769 RepID=UPI0003199C0C|nr:hypothetical protein [Mycobacterium leprae]
MTSLCLALACSVEQSCATGYPAEAGGAERSSRVGLYLTFYYLSITWVGALEPWRLRRSTGM